MNKRKQKIIDKKFQLQTTFSVIGIFFVITCLLMIVIGINVYNDNKKIFKIIRDQKTVIDSQSEIDGLMLENLNIKDDSESNILLKMKEKSLGNIEAMRGNTDQLEKLIKRNTDIFLIIIIFIIAAGFILYPVLIRKTHKISGPVYIMSEYMKEIISGSYPDLRPLRKKDELKEFYELFSRLVAFLKKQDNKK